MVAGGSRLYESATGCPRALSLLPAPKIKARVRPEPDALATCCGGPLRQQQLGIRWPLSRRRVCAVAGGTQQAAALGVERRRQQGSQLLRRRSRLRTTCALRRAGSERSSLCLEARCFCKQCASYRKGGGSRLRRCAWRRGQICPISSKDVKDGGVQDAVLRSGQADPVG